MPTVPAKRAVSEIKSENQYKKSKPRLNKRESKEGPNNDDVLNLDLTNFVRNLSLTANEDLEHLTPEQTEVDVKITSITSAGDGLGRSLESPSEVFVVPFGVPGDVVRAKAYRQLEYPVAHTLADFVRIVEPSADRDDSRVKCRYFSRCSGCQYQMLSYEKQLELKREVVQKAFDNFSNLPPELVPTVGNVFASPLQYGFRTKLTPHFDGPPGVRGPRKYRRGRPKVHFETVPPIGFLAKGTKQTVDIEECPVGSDVLQLGLKRERRRVEKTLEKYTQGGTILLRESTERVPRDRIQADITVPSTDESSSTIYEDGGEDVLVKTCVSDEKGTSTEYIDDLKFVNSAGSFFQNNNSILPSFTSYIRDQVSTPGFSNLIDAYCGSGLFTITLGSLFDRSIGIDIDFRSIERAKEGLRHNASVLAKNEPSVASQATGENGAENGSEPSSEPSIKPEAAMGSSEKFSKGIHFIAADAAKLFEAVKDFAPDDTAVILDPPRKGCDTNFLRQLLYFAPARIVYVSCNVHTQARDIGWLLRGGETGEKDEPVENAPYLIDSLIGFDFFPQTHHVEGVAVLSRTDFSSNRAANGGSKDEHATAIGAT